MGSPRGAWPSLPGCRSLPMLSCGVLAILAGLLVLGDAPSDTVEERGLLTLHVVRGHEAGLPPGVLHFPPARNDKKQPHIHTSFGTSIDYRKIRSWHVSIMNLTFVCNQVAV